MNTFLQISTNLCGSTCSDEYYGDSSTRKCTACFSGCKTCFGTTLNKCSSCMSGLFYSNFSCNTTCPIGTYKNSSSNNCDTCY